MFYFLDQGVHVSVMVKFYPWFKFLFPFESKLFSHTCITLPRNKGN